MYYSKLPKVIMLFLLYLLIQFLSGTWVSVEDSYEDIIGCDKVDYVFDIDQDKVVFYEKINDDNDLMFGCGYLEKKLGGYEFVRGDCSSQHLSEKEIFSFQTLINDIDKNTNPLSIIYGKTSLDTKNISFQDEDTEKEYKAKLVKKDDYKLWYFFTRDFKEETGLRIKIVKENGEIIKLFREFNASFPFSIFIKVAKGMGFIFNSFISIIILSFIWWVSRKYRITMEYDIY